VTDLDLKVKKRNLWGSVTVTFDTKEFRLGGYIYLEIMEISNIPVKSTSASGLVAELNLKLLCT
jgi:hypothetical protein